MELRNQKFGGVSPLVPQIAKFMGPIWGPPGSCRPQMGPMLALWTLLSGAPHTSAMGAWSRWMNGSIQHVQRRRFTRARRVFPSPHAMHYDHGGNLHLFFHWQFPCKALTVGAVQGDESGLCIEFNHDDVIKWIHFPHYWPFARGIHRSPVNSPQTASDAEFWCFLWSAPE